MLAARAYKERITLYRSAMRTDEFGALKPDTPELYANRYAQVLPLGENRKMYYFNTTSVESYEITCRFLGEKPRWVKWKDQMMVVESAEDVGNNHKIMRIVVSKR